MPARLAAGAINTNHQRDKLTGRPCDATGSIREICMNWWWNCVKKSHRLESTLNHRRVTVTHISFSIIFTRRYNLRYNLISMKIAQKPSLKLQLRSEDEFPHSTWVSIKFNNHRSMQVDFLLQIFNILNDWKQSVHHLNDNCGWFFVWVWSRYHNSVYCVIVLSVWIDNPVERVVSFIWTSSEHRSHPSFIDMSLLPPKVQNAWHAPLLVIDRNCCSSDNWIFTQTCHSSFFPTLPWPNCPSGYFSVCESAGSYVVLSREFVDPLSEVRVNNHKNCDRGKSSKEQSFIWKLWGIGWRFQLIEYRAY